MNKRVLFIDDQLEDWEGLLRRGLEPFGFELKGEKTLPMLSKLSVPINQT